MKEKIAPIGRRALFLALAAACASCGGEESRMREIAASRTYEPVDGGFRWNASPRDRFRFGLPQMPAASAGTGAGGGGHSGSGDLHWNTPEGWQEAATSSLRQANFQIGDDTECYLTILSGDGGGLAPNVNRWRKQMSLPEASAAEIAALPRANFFGGLGTFVDLEGTFTGMSGDEAGANYRLLGLAQVVDGAARFLKLVGPKASVDREVDAFRELAASFHADHGEEGAASDPHAGLDIETRAAVGASDRGQGLRWETPEGWTAGPDRPMRAVTFTLGDDPQAECYVVVLAGEGGGVEANINRWCSQMGADDLSASAVAALPRVPMLGTEGILVEIPGAYTGMGDADVPDALLLGAVAMLPQSSVFVKMVGPQASVEANREAFRAFCRSLEVAP